MRAPLSIMTGGNAAIEKFNINQGEGMRVSKNKQLKFWKALEVIITDALTR